MKKLRTPLSVKDIQKLRVGDEVLLSGKVFTCRDQAYNFILKHNFPQIKNSVIYHAGPLVQGKMPISAGPTTSARFEKRSIKLMQKYSIKAFIGKGGMDDDEVKKAMKNKAVYLAAVGGAGVLYAKAMKIENIYLRQFGMADSVWEIEVKDFPLIVAMDAHGNSIYHDIYLYSKKKVTKFLK
jgi:tartrate/fumarate subfamily iron-sulfur-dependent hydro-lyase beta chain